MLETSRVTTSEIAYKRLLDIRKIWPGQPEYVYAFANYLASYATIDFDASTFILDAAICLDEWLTIRRPFDLSIDYNSVVYLPAQI